MNGGTGCLSVCMCGHSYVKLCSRTRRGPFAGNWTSSRKTIQFDVEQIKKKSALDPGKVSQWIGWSAKNLVVFNMKIWYKLLSDEVRELPYWATEGEGRLEPAGIYFLEK